MMLKELKMLNKVNLDGYAKDFTKTDFWHYTTLKTASSILDGGEFWVNPLSSMADKSENGKNFIEEPIFNWTMAGSFI